MFELTGISRLPFIIIIIGTLRRQTRLQRQRKRHFNINVLVTCIFVLRGNSNSFNSHNEAELS